MSATGPASVGRPRLSSSAPALHTVEELVGDRVVVEQAAMAGFTRSIASTVHLAGGGRVFVKAGEVGDSGGDAVTTGAALAPVIANLGPALLGHRIVDGWSVAIYEHIPGAAIDQWDDDAVEAM